MKNHISYSASSHNHSLNEVVTSLINVYHYKWINTDYDQANLKNIDYEIKLNNEKGFDKLMQSFNNQFKGSCNNRPQITLDDQNLEFLSVFLECDKNVIKSFFSKSFFDASCLFVKKAKEFDQHIQSADIYQAIRNAWIGYSIQLFFKKTIYFSDPLFAYSMLYPYTDNYLDNVSILNEQKEMFNLSLKSRLEGIKVKGKNDLQSKIFNLIKIIEDNYNRKDFPFVYSSLLAIHSAQCESIHLHEANNLSVDEVIHLSFNKGGCSVLADGYLVNPMLTIEQMHFLFGYGILLQLLDDLQDLEEDIKNNQRSLFNFNLAGKRYQLIALTNQLINFCCSFYDEQFKRIKKNSYFPMLKKCCILLIFRAIASHSMLYPSCYLSKIEKFSPLSFSYLGDLHKKSQSKSNKKEDLIDRLVSYEYN